MDLQATVEFAIELHKFYNIDLFQRGLYQLKCYLKVLPKILPVQFETTIGEDSFPGQNYGASRIFQILYRNEEVLLRDVIMFRVHLLVDSRHLKESIERAEFVLTVELWFGDQASDQDMSMVSSRTLQLNFHPVLGLHYHLPILFDYFHLSAVSIQINASLIVISTNYVNLHKNTKLWNSSSKLNCRTPPTGPLDFASGQLDALFFGTQVGNSIRCAGGNSQRLGHARNVHKEICELLLGALDSLNITLEEFNIVTPINYKSNRKILNVEQRLKQIMESAETMENEDDFASHANSNIAKLCAECVSLWRKVVSATSKTSIKNLLAKKNHTLRVRRFSEGFFVINHSRQQIYETNGQNYIEICQVARGKYLTSIPMLPVHCMALDGDALTLPLIFEDKFEIGGNSNEPTPTMLMNGSGVYEAKDRPRAQSILSNRSMNGSLKNPKQPQCSCKVEPDTVSCKYMGGVTTPRFALGRDILQASLTIIPQAAQVDLRGTHFAKNGLNYGNFNCVEACGVLPTRHSKSLDQLEQEPNCITPRSETFYGGTRGNEEFLYKTLQVLEVTRASQDLGLPLKKRPGIQQREDLLKNINEFKQKYKNPGSQMFPGMVSLNDIELTQLISTEEGTGETKCTLTLDRFPGKRAENAPKDQKSVSQNGFHFNSLPKNSTINGTTPPARQKRYSKHHSTPREMGGSFSTLPRSKSTQNINRQKREQQSQQQQRSHHSFRYSRVRITDYKHQRKKSRSRRSVASQRDSSSSSTESEKGLYERCKMPPRSKNQKKILSSVSVPHQLEHLNGVDAEAGVQSDSLPSSSSSSPRLVKSESLKINGKKSNSEQKENTYGYLTNGRRQTNEGLKQKPPRQTKKGSEKSKSEFDLPNANDATIEDLKLVPPEQFRDTIFTPLPPEEFRDSDEINHNNVNGAKVQSETRSETHERRQKPKKVALPTTTHNMQLLRQQQHPVFKAQAIDNPLYHMCTIGQQLQSDKPSSKIITKSQSTNELFGMERNNSYNASRMSLNNGISHSNSPKSLQKMDTLSIRDSGSEKQVMQPPLLEFEKCREEFRKQVNYMGSIYSDFTKLASELPYFYISDELRVFSPNGLHLIVCVHGLDGNANDLRLFRTYLELGLPGANLDFLMSERNQGDTFSDFDTMTERLVNEILYHIESYGLNPAKISFVAHSLGTILVRAALTKPQMKPFLGKLQTFLSLSGPHLGTLYNTSGLVNMGMWFMQKWKKSGSLLQLCLRDASDLRQCYLYKLSQKSTLHHFKNILLVGSLQDRYVPLHSARLEICKQAQRDNSPTGIAYKEMVHNILSPIISKTDPINVSRFDVHHALPRMTNASVLIGRAAHISFLDSELFIEKFLLVAGLKYFT
ncbi:protein FAM135A [Culicoides brevitarsis]|uniref:protein FAM135A n=1 Tax=Culicoides brevitarsis TaxID=469753 RepID=UPI00307B4FA6